jgi:hypothetical protein
MSCEVFIPEEQKPQKPHRPIMVQVKIKDHSRMALVLAAGSSHSFSRSIRTSFHYFIRSPHQLQHPACKCFMPLTHPLPNHGNPFSD